MTKENIQEFITQENQWEVVEDIHIKNDATYLVECSHTLSNSYRVIHKLEVSPMDNSLKITDTYVSVHSEQ